MRILALLALATGLCAQPPQLDTISDTIYLPNGTTYSGTLLIQSSVTLASGRVIVNTLANLSISNGVLSTQLVPSSNTNPSTSYVFRLNNNQSVLTCFFPYSATPIGLASYCIPGTPTATPPPGVVLLSQLAQGGAGVGSVLTWSGTAWAPGGATTITLKTNGTNNGSQSILNLAAGSNVTLTDNGSGTVTVASSAGSGTVSSIVFSAPLTGGTVTTTGTVGIPQATTLVDGYLSHVDWAAFNAKQAALGYTPLNPANNLSDVSVAATARTNLGLATVAATGSAADLGSGTLLAARMPALTGDCTVTVGTVAIACGSAIARTGTDINTSNQVTATHLAAALPVNQGGTGTTSTLTGIVRGNGTAMTAAELSGDATTSGSNAVTNKGMNGVLMSSLATGILKNTTTTGVPSIAVAADFPTLNQNTTGSAATLTTPRSIYGNNFDGSAALSQIIASTFGGTGNGFTKFSGPTTAEKTFTLPDASATLLYSGGALGTPSSGTLTSAIGLPLTTGVTGILPAANGGSGVNNTATLTLGSSNQNWATLGTGIVKNTTTTGAITNAVAADVYGLWSGCSSTTVLFGTGTCAVPFTLTTTGSSGAATFSGGTLNIPQYSGGGGGVTSIATTYPIQGGPITTSGAVTCATCGPNANKGSVIVAAFGASATAGHKGFTGGLIGGGCTGTGATGAWPVAGYARGTVLTTSGANGNLWMRGNVNVDCTGVINAALGPSPGGALIPPGSAAGAFIDAAPEYWHFQQGSQQAAGWAKTGTSAGTAATVTALAMEFVDDSGAYYSVLGGSANGQPPTASATTYNSFPAWWNGGSFQTAELTVAIPIPFAATLGPFTVCTSGTSPTNNETMAINRNGVASTMTTTITAADAAPGCYGDFTHTVSASAGDYIDMAVTTGSGTTSTFGQWLLALKPQSGTSTMLAGQIGSTVTTTANYSLPGTNQWGTTQANFELGVPIACTASNLYVVQAAANGGGVTTTFTLNKNGIATAVTGTITSGSGTGAIAVDTTHSASFAKGDLMQLQFVTISGTSGTMGGWAIQCQ